jgi:hypothetical protein
MQLLKLDDAIRNSPNPESTLNQVAEANQMPPEELLRMLERNHREMEAAGGTSVMDTRSNLIWKLASSVGVVVAQAAAKHPKLFVLTIAALVCILVVATTAPSTGLVLSTHRSLVSGGPTTFWSPPAKYIRHRFLDTDKQRRGLLSVGQGDFSEQLRALLSEEQEDVTWQKVPRKQNSEMKFVASTHSSIDTSKFVPQSISQDVDGELSSEEAASRVEELEEAMNLLLEHASNLLGSLDLTEFVDSSKSIRLVTDDRPSRKQNAVLVVAGMGDLNRFGLQPLRVTSESDSKERLSLTLSTLKGGHCDAQLHVSIERSTTERSVVDIRTSFVFPRSGRKTLGRSVALRIIQGLNESIETSLRTRMRQSIARRSQSSHFQGKAQSRAKERRDTRSSKERAMEEMAEDRRRRWQRKNPNTGSYRPSGDRMRSPKNAVY